MSISRIQHQELTEVFGCLHDPRASAGKQPTAPVDLYSISQDAISWAHEDRDEMEPHLQSSKGTLIALQNGKIEPTQRRRMVLEVVAKMLSYLRLECDSEFQIPSFDETSKLNTYTARVCNLGSGNIMYVFLPKDDKSLPPILSFRGTVTNDPGTLWSTIGPRGLCGWLTGYFYDVGANIVENNRGKILEVLKDLQDQGYNAKVVMTGHSLGGALAQRFMVEDGVHQRVQSVAAFNSPTINFSATKKWNSLVNKKEVKDDQVEVYNVQGDLLADHDSFLDRYFIGRKVVLIPSEHTDMTSAARHSVCATSIGGELRYEKRSKSSESWLVWGLTRIPMFVVFLLASVVTLLYAAATEVAGGCGGFKAYMVDREERSVAQRAVATYINENDEKNNILNKIKLEHQYWWDRSEPTRGDISSISRKVWHANAVNSASEFFGLKEADKREAPLSMGG